MALNEVSVKNVVSQEGIVEDNPPSVIESNGLKSVECRMSDLSELSDDQLREVLKASRQTITSLVLSLVDRPDMQDAIERLMRPDDMLESFSELAVKQPDLMRLVLQASVAALVNAQAVEGSDAELKRRAIKGN